MSKFVMECPNCGKYVEAKTGFLASRKIKCDCGYTINVKTDKMATRTCPHCGNVFVYDQSEGNKVRCPVCRQKIMATENDTKLVEFSCHQCGVRLSTTKNASTYTCPVCDCVNDVAEQLKMEQIKHDGLASIIKYEGDNETLVWKHPIEDFNMGSQLIVHESQEAIFFKDGQALDLFGAGRYTLETQQLPILEKMYQLPTDTEGTFHSEVYYINMATLMGVKWGTDSKVRLFDPATGMHLEIGASGEFNIRVTNSRKLLLKLVGTTGGLSQQELLGAGGNRGFFRAMVMTQAKSFLAQTIKENSINILEIDEHLMALSDALREKINAYLEDYGLIMPEFFVSRVVTPDEDPNFRRLKEQYAEQYLGVKQEQIRKNIAEAEAQRKAVEAQTAAQMKIIGAQGEAETIKIKAQAEAEAYKAKAMAEAEEMRAKGYTYQQETARQVSLEAMQNGLTGGEGGNGAAGSMLNGVGEIAGLGMTLGAMGSVVGMTKDILNPVMDTASQMGQAVAGTAANEWNCAQCGQTGITSNFCPNCGAKRPMVKIGWDCSCGQRGITSNFCPNCGAKKPEPEQPETWDCTCGSKGITSNFCPNCGKKKGE